MAGHESGTSGVSNPFKTGRYCVDDKVLGANTLGIEFQTPSKRGGTA